MLYQVIRDNFLELYESAVLANQWADWTEEELRNIRRLYSCLLYTSDAADE